MSQQQQPVIDIPSKEWDVFFFKVCVTDGRIPDCAACEHNLGNSGCTHPLNPNNLREE